jgi:aspartate/methionine/tyrosine aminotransferase
MTKVQQYSFVCAPSVVQWAALACPQVDSSANLESYRRERNTHFRIYTVPDEKLKQGAELLCQLAQQQGR